MADLVHLSSVFSALRAILSIQDEGNYFIPSQNSGFFPAKSRNEKLARICGLSVASGVIE